MASRIQSALASQGCRAAHAKQSSTRPAGGESPRDPRGKGSAGVSPRRWATSACGACKGAGQAVWPALGRGAAREGRSGA